MADVYRGRRAQTDPPTGRMVGAPESRFCARLDADAGAGREAVPRCADQQGRGELAPTQLPSVDDPARPPLAILAWLFRSDEPRPTSSADLGWARLIPDLHVVPVLGDHTSCIGDGPFVGGNCEKLVAALDLAFIRSAGTRPAQQGPMAQTNRGIGPICGVVSAPRVEEHLVDVAPAPAFGRVIALDDRMPGGVEMLGGVACSGIVAAADMAAGPAEPQMHPCASRSSGIPRSPSALGVTLWMPATWVQASVLIGAPSATAGCGVGRDSACSAATTWAPSPTAPPTRLTEPERTSPTANTPGRLVSSGRARPSPPSARRSRTKPLASSVTPQPASQSVAGSAPTNRNRCGQLALRLRRRRGGCASARARATAFLAFQRDHLGVVHQLDIRRAVDALDQIARHAGVRGRRRGSPARPCGRGRPETPPPGPAELPPPTSTTSCPAHSRASIGEAQ